MLFKKLLYFTLPASVFASPPCYWPDGTLAKDYTSCGEDTNQCCSKESICLTNGYCMSMVFSFNLSRATCKDRTWRTCKNPCAEVTDRQNGGCALPFWGTINGEAAYCPDSIVPNATGVGCSDGTEPFTVGPASIITNKAALEGASCAVDPLNPKIGATQAATATHTSSFPTATNGTGSSCNSDSGSSDNSNSKNAAIGAGVGVPLGVISLATIGWALAERKKRYQLINSPPPQPMVVQQVMPQTQPQEMATTQPGGVQELEGAGYKYK
ncbi:hypothetical protein PHISCL_03570 [Aspergillus sclerotialis]|uniref:Uncharacterized protein n=1 Tax=Aspergillus sclerotialis TaxID=2070753 RepID=A0A3A3A408_9EURO|nr:hypothetical protein PHISCL_03570 [Aspergillus sclerotialis]